MGLLSPASFHIVLVPGGVTAQGTHQRPAPVPGARVLASLAPGAEEGLMQPEPGHMT